MSSQAITADDLREILNGVLPHNEEHDFIPDYSNHIHTLNGFGSYTPSVDCFMVAYIYGKSAHYATVTIDGNQVVNTWQESSTMTRIVFTTPVKAGKPIVYSAAAGNPASGALEFYGFY